MWYVKDETNNLYNCGETTNGDHWVNQRYLANEYSKEKAEEVINNFKDKKLKLEEK